MQVRGGCPSPTGLVSLGAGMYQEERGKHSEGERSESAGHHGSTCVVPPAGQPVLEGQADGGQMGGKGGGRGSPGERI